MKNVLLLMLLLCTVGNAKTIDLEPRVGASYTRHWGIHIGALASYSLSNTFYSQPGVLIHTVGGSDRDQRIGNWKLGLDVPLYAPFRMPLNDVTKIRLNAGPYLGWSSRMNLGTAVETGAEFRKMYVGISWLQNFVNQNCARLHFSIGYKFAL